MIVTNCWTITISKSNLRHYLSEKGCWEMAVQGALWLAKHYPSTIISIFLSRFYYFSNQVANQFTVADGGFGIWGGLDVMRGCIKCKLYIKYKYWNYYLYSKISRRSFLFANLSISSSCHVGWLCSFLRVLFSIDTQARVEIHSCVIEFLKKVLARFEHKKFLSTEALCK